MRVLLVYAHPLGDSLNAEIKSAAEEVSPRLVMKLILLISTRIASTQSCLNTSVRHILMIILSVEIRRLNMPNA